MIRNVLAVLCVLVSLWQNSPAQTFQKLYGDTTVSDVGHSLIQTSDGGFLISGTQYTSGNYIESFFLIRTDPNGDTLWTRLIKEASVNYSGLQVISTYDGGFAIVGIETDWNYAVPFFLKIDSSGNILWNHTYLWFAEEQLNSVVQTPDSGFLLSGYLYNGNGNMLVYFIRTDVNGDTLWTKTYGESNFNTQVYSLRMAPDGGFVAGGFIQDQLTQNVDAFLFKTDSAGNFLWAKSYGDNIYDYCQQVEVTAEGGLILAAVTYTQNNFADFCLIKSDSSGNLEWSKNYGSTDEDRSENVRQTSDGGYLISGESSSFSSGNFDNYFVRTDANGDTLWTKTINGLQNNQGYSMILTNDGGFAVTGEYYAHQSNNDVFFLKADSLGFIGCSEKSTNTVVDSPLLTVDNHPMTFFPAQPTVVAHTMEVKSGTSLSTICEYDFIDINLKQEFIVFPNPVSEKLFITWKENNKPTRVRILNMYASEIISNSEINRTSALIDCRMLSPGIYLIEISSGEMISYQKIVKE